MTHMTSRLSGISIVALLATLSACTEQVVNAVPVVSVDVSPPAATVGVGNTVQLGAVAKDGSGNALHGRDITWSTSDPDHATVDNGLVRGVAPGGAVITASIQGAEGQATVTVAGTSLLLQPDTLTFGAQVGGENPAPAQARLTSGGNAVDGVTASVAYTVGGGGWLTVALAETKTPLDVTARVNSAALSAGEYAATISLTAPAAGDTARLHVLLHMTTSPPPSPPAAPSSLKASAISATQVSVTWKDNSSDETEFRLQRSANGGSTWTQVAIVAANATSYSDTGLQPSTSYGYRIQSCSSAGCSSYSNAATATTPAPPAQPPAAPTNLGATATSATRVDLTWKDNSTDETEFRLQRSTDGGTTWTQIATLAPNARSYADTTVRASTAYAYRIQSCSSAGCSSYSNAATATTPAAAPTAPAAPSGLQAEAASATRVDLTWTDNSTDETEFRLERSADGGSTWAQIATPATNATSYADTTAHASTAYSYRIRACSAAGCSAYSNEASTTTPAPPPSPVIALDPTSVSFTANAGNSAGSQQVDVSNSGGGTLSGLSAGVDYGSGPNGWLTASLSGTSAPATLTIGASAFGLGEGTYTANVAVSSDAASNSPQTVSVTMVVQPAGNAVIVLDSSAVTFEATLLGPAPGSKTVQVDNGGSDNLGGLYTSVEYGSGQPTGWLSAELGRGKAPTDLTLSVSRSGLLPGTYTATVYVASGSASNSPQSVKVTFNLTTL